MITFKFAKRHITQQKVTFRDAKGNLLRGE